MNASTIACWLARCASLISGCLLMLFLFGEESDPNRIPTAGEAVGLFFFPIGVIAGFTWSWRNEFRGGVTTLFSLTAFYVWHLLSTGSFPQDPYFLLFAFPAILFLMAWSLRSRDSQSNPIRDSTGN